MDAGTACGCRGGGGDDCVHCWASRWGGRRWVGLRRFWLITAGLTGAGLTTMVTVLVGGAVACIVGALASGTLWVAVSVTAAFCFAVTFARVVSQPMASTSVIVLVIYFAGFGGGRIRARARWGMRWHFCWGVRGLRC